MGAAQGVAESLRGAGHTVEVRAVGPGVGPAGTPEVNADVIVVAGGDGTLLHAVGAWGGTAGPVAPAGTQAPAFYHLPWGNENLFAREFAMGRDTGALAAALSEGRRERVDLGWAMVMHRTGTGTEARSADGTARQRFLIMVSIGPDAGVIHRLHATRTSAGGYRAYLGPFIAKCLRPSFPRLAIRVDGREVVRSRRGLLIVANCRRYALGIDPARRADMTDGLLDVVLLPCATVTGALAWLALARLGCHLRSRRAIVARGREVEVENAGSRPAPVQFDGEIGPVLGPAGPGGRGGVLRIGVEPAAVTVLRPPARG